MKGSLAEQNVDILMMSGPEYVAHAKKSGAFTEAEVLDMELKLAEQKRVEAYRQGDDEEEAWLQLEVAQLNQARV